MNQVPVGVCSNTMISALLTVCGSSLDWRCIDELTYRICLSRLYSPHPRLHFPLALLPSPQYPLTPTYPSLFPPPNYTTLSASLPPLSILATPHLLLSLLATTIYLGHTSLMREALAKFNKVWRQLIACIPVVDRIVPKPAFHWPLAK